jgi:S-DNA-T family DNA segregation ATPase FtsK/SpoIIIE
MYQTWDTPDITYSRLYADMLRQVHMLIAGATGSGKSTVVNGMIHAALRNSPVQVGLILIDPKGCELAEYADLPHVIDYANRPQDIPRALRGAVALMNNRLADMKRRRLREYDGSDVYVIIDELMPIMTRPDIKKACYSPLLDLLALACFVEPKDVDEHTMEEYMVALTEMMNNKAVNGFFTSLVRWGQTSTLTA